MSWSTTCLICGAHACARRLRPCVASRWRRCAILRLPARSVRRIVLERRSTEHMTKQIWRLGDASVAHCSLCGVPTGPSTRGTRDSRVRSRCGAKGLMMFAGNR
jgi:hypothetical protein